MIKWKEVNTVSNYISFFRLLLAIPFWILADHLNDGDVRYYLFGLCLFASFTDILDGYVARHYNQTSETGKIIDPLADKIAIAVLVFKLYLIGEITPGYFYLIISRDLLIFIGGIIVTKMIGKVLPSNVLGKAAVTNIGIVILLIILQVDRTSIFFSGLYYLSILLIVVSFIAYTLRAVEFLKRREYGSVR